MATVAASAMQNELGDDCDGLIRRSQLISRSSLAKLSGGKTKDNTGKRQSSNNPLGLRSPVSFTGGPAIATKEGKISHIVLKGSMNEPLPTQTNKGEVCYTLNRCENSRGSVPRDVPLLKEQAEEFQLQRHKKISGNGSIDRTEQGDDNNPIQQIPMFWEPAQQKDHTTNLKTTMVQYVGHWVTTNVSLERFKYGGIPRCAKIMLQLVEFREDFDAVIDDFCVRAAEQKTDATRSPAQPGSTIVKEEEPAELPSKKQKYSLRNSSNRNRETLLSVPDTAVAASSRAQYEDDSDNDSVCIIDDPRSNKRIKKENNDEQPLQPLSGPDFPRFLEDYTASDVASMIARKGPKFTEFAKELEEADFKGSFLIDELEEDNEQNFLQFLHDCTCLKNRLLGLSVLKSLKEIPRKKKAPGSNN